MMKGGALFRVSYKTNCCTLSIMKQRFIRLDDVVKKMIVAKINLWKFVHCGGKLILMFSTLFFTSVYVCCQELQM